VTETVDAQPEQPAWRRIVIEKPEPHGPRSVEQLKEVWLEDPAWNLDETAGFEGYREHLRDFSEGARAAWNHPQPGEERTDHQVLVSIAQLLTEQLATMQHIRQSLDQPTESRSSCTVKTSTRGHDLEVKSYNDGLLAGAVNDALENYCRGMRELTEVQKNGWERTAAMVANGELP
jgi:hypothetical protein